MKLSYQGDERLSEKGRRDFGWRKFARKTWQTGQYPSMTFSYLFEQVGARVSTLYHPVVCPKDPTGVRKVESIFMLDLSR